MTTSSVEAVEAQAAAFRECFAHVKHEIARVFVGQPELVEHLLVCFFCQGHALLEGAPGLGKTLLVRTLAEAVSVRFSRVQCTPDLMPADVTGTNILVDTPSGGREFNFERGPIFAHVVLADEINRATPRTQSAFLEAMQEGHVTVFGTTHAIGTPFSVFATENPIEMEGTYPLPEAQLDRFFFKLTVKPPSVGELAEIMARTTGAENATVSARFGPEDVRGMLGLIRHVKIADETLHVALKIVSGTHPDSPDAPPAVKQYVRYGASPRGAQAIVLAAKTLALLAGRYHVSADDIQRVVVPALNHRLILNFQGEMDRVSRERLLSDVLSHVAS
ncbi:MAG TPA: MoxR family ATPase [Vicinamibacterales bacterium]|nr:MoxR family ATPase [Vicinamibacterales bacterium]